MLGQADDRARKGLGSEVNCHGMQLEEMFRCSLEAACDTSLREDELPHMISFDRYINHLEALGPDAIIDCAGVSISARETASIRCSAGFGP